MKYKETSSNLNTSEFIDERLVEIAQRLTTRVLVSCPPFSRISEKCWTAFRHCTRIGDVNSQAQLYNDLTEVCLITKRLLENLYIQT
ncbi:MAG: hypothetical protein ACTS4W_00935 [Candidatus Hodgkinia cicadicola]